MRTRRNWSAKETRTCTIAYEECEVDQGIRIDQTLLVHISPTFAHISSNISNLTVMSVRSAHMLVANPVLSVRITSRRIMVSERVKPVRERRSKKIRVTEIDMSLMAERMLTDRVTHSRSERLEKVGRDDLRRRH